MAVKVAHISVANTGGAGIAAFRLHKALLDSGEIESFFIQQIPNKDNSGYQIYSVDKKKYSYKDRFLAKLGLDIDTKNKNRLSILNKCNCEIASLPDTYYRIEDHPIVKDADIINLHWVADFLNYPTFFKKIKKPIVWTLHDMNPFNGIFHYEEDLIRNKDIVDKLNKKVLLEKLYSIHKASNITVVSPSEWLKEKSLQSKILGLYPHFCIPNSIDISSIKKLSKSEAKRKLDLNSNYTFLFISHNIEVIRKGFDILKSALDNINLKINLITVGSGNIETNSSINHVHYDRISDIELLNTIYTAADMTILPSREDNLPNVMLESFANGTPVMSFHNGGMADYIIPQKTGILIPKINSSALASSITRVVVENIKFEANVIREFAQFHFSVFNQTTSYLDLYQKILEE